MKNLIQDVDLETLKSILSYDPETGMFKWLIRPRQKACPSDFAGFITDQKYRMIGIRGKRYCAHRLAWLYMTGKWPEGEIDHINGIYADNRWCNLRQANKQTNQANSKKRSTNNTGFKGAGSPLAGRTRFPARITVNYKTIWLGSFSTAEEAHEAYVKAAKEHFGEFARAS